MGAPAVIDVEAFTLIEGDVRLIETDVRVAAVDVIAKVVNAVAFRLTAGAARVVEVDAVAEYTPHAMAMLPVFATVPVLGVTGTAAELVPVFAESAK